MKSLCFLFRQVDTGWFTVGSVGIHGIRGLLPPSPTTEMFSIGNALGHKLYILHAQAYPETYCEPYPLNHLPLLVEMLAAGRLQLNCCKAVATLLLNCCYRLQLDFMLCNYFMHWVLGVICICLRVCLLLFEDIWGSFQGSFWGRFEGRSRPLPSLPTQKPSP